MFSGSASSSRHVQENARAESFPSEKSQENSMFSAWNFPVTKSGFGAPKGLFKPSKCSDAITSNKSRRSCVCEGEGHLSLT